MPRPMDREKKAATCAQLEAMVRQLEQMLARLERVRLAGFGVGELIDGVDSLLDEARRCVRVAGRV